MQILQFAILGLGTGAIFALFGQAIVVINLGSGTLNFAAGAFGMLGAYAFYAFRPHGALTVTGALLVAIVVSAAAGAGAYVLVMRRLVEAPETSRIVATLGLMVLALEGISVLSKSKGAAQLVRSPLPAATVSLGSGITLGVDRLVITGVAIALTAVLSVGRRHTRLGLATSAVAENRLVAASMGWSPGMVASIAWAIGSGLAAVGAVFAASLSGLSASGLTLLVVPSLAAALFGRFQSFGWTLVAAMAIGVCESEVSRYVTSPGWPTAVPLLAIVVVLVARGTALPDRAEHTQRRPRVGTAVPLSRAVIAGLTATALVAFAPLSWLDPVATTALFGLLVLSLVVVAGYAGQLSLAQASIAALAAYFTAWIAVHTSLPLAITVVVAVVACTPVAAVFAFPALRTRGSNLAIATLSLAVAVDSLVISNPQRVSGLEGRGLGELSLFGLDLGGTTHPTSFAITAVVVLALACIGVVNLRRGRCGRRLLAVRSNERAAAAIGISVPWAKLYAFWLSAMLAAAAGALTEARFATGDFSSYQLFDNINVVLYAVIGGIGWVAGAVLGALGVPGGVTARVVASLTSNAGTWLILLGGAGAVVIVVQSPDGLAPLLRRQAVGLAAMIHRKRAIDQRSVSPSPGRRSRREATLPANYESAPPLAGATLSVREITVRFGSQTALDNAGFEVKSGEILGLIGPNGAGKSTMIDVVTGFHRPSSGTVILNGARLDELGPARRSRAGLGRSFQNLELFDDLTVLENLLTAADRTGVRHHLADLVWPRQDPVKAEMAAAIRAFDLTEVLDQRPAELDYGKRRLVAIARTLSAAPSVVLLDEPAAGLDERKRVELTQLLRRLAADRGIAIVLVEHDIQLVFAVCHRVVVLDQGRVIADGSVAEVQRDPAVVAAYLGGPDRRDALLGQSLRHRPGVTSEHLLELCNVDAGYSGVPVLQRINAAVSPGEVVAVLGANGAGKTTLIHTVAGVLPSLGGRILYDHSPLTGGLHRRARRGIALVTDERAIIRGLTVRQNLKLATRHPDLTLSLFPQLEALLDRKAGLLSGGEQQMLVLARVLLNQPRLLIVDELSFGLAPLILEQLLRAVRAAADEGAAVLIVEQHPSLALSIADYGYVLNRGEVVLEGAAAQLHARLGEIEQAYLGLVADASTELRPTEDSS
jgi:ABC-type branched-subunit amino acid transport system ATPase component/branched-subunit amino acid ABC-type transport system permease component